MKAIVLAYDGGSVVGTVGDELPFVRSTGGVVGGELFFCSGGGSDCSLLG